MIYLLLALVGVLVGIRLQRFEQNKYAAAVHANYKQAHKELLEIHQTVMGDIPVIDQFDDSWTVGLVKRQTCRLIHLMQQLEKVKPLAGNVFVFTGRLEGHPRLDNIQRIQQLGGKIASSVSKKTDYLVVGASPGYKLNIAASLGVPLLTQYEFINLLQRSERIHERN